MDPVWIALIAVAAVIVLLVVIFFAWWISTSNRLRKEAIKCDEAASGIDVALTKRFDLLTKAVETVRGYAKHEKETLTDVISMRQPSATDSMKAKSDFANQLEGAFRNLNVVVERYPDLKASQNFIALQNQISEVEEHLQASRRIYNSNVTILNQDIVVFPSSIVARHIHMTQREFFEAEEHKRQDVEIKF